MIQFSEDYNAQTIFEQVWEAPYSWWGRPPYSSNTILPNYVAELDEDGETVQTYHVTAEMIENAVFKTFKEVISKRTGGWATNLADWLQDLDAGDVDLILQYAVFGEFRYE